MSERQTALHAAHERLEARFTDFGGWSMPVRLSLIHISEPTRPAA